jgi:hypothetical protein
MEALTIMRLVRVATPPEISKVTQRFVSGGENPT